MPALDDKTLENELREMIRQIIEVDPAQITRDADFMQALGMDSMMALEILAAMEKKYKIRIPEEKLPQLKNLNEVIRVAKEHMA